MSPICPNIFLISNSAPGEVLISISHLNVRWLAVKIIDVDSPWGSILRRAEVTLFFWSKDNDSQATPFTISLYRASNSLIASDIFLTISPDKDSAGTVALQAGILISLIRTNLKLSWLNAVPALC